ncbi:MAG: helix-turn-helix transcriptional regulator [Pigmentiphaga sp.]|nr:helix-turn-helix transcriptional regulator [Pigmentiphaga sp.]
MFKVSIQPHWHIQSSALPAGFDSNMLIGLLRGIQEEGSIAAAGRRLGLSYRYVWGLLREAEQGFGLPLLDKQPGRGTVLSHLGQTLLMADERIQARLSPTLSSLASELDTELRKAVFHAAQVTRLFASHGFAIATLIEQLAQQGVVLELRYQNSLDAVAALSQGECDVAGFHIPIGGFQRAAAAAYRAWLDPRQYVVLQVARRQQGLSVAPGNPKQIRDLADLVRADVKFVNRHPGSGTRMLLDLMLAARDLPINQIRGYDTAEFTHAAVAAYIASDMADVGLGIEAAARRFQLDFVPLFQERYFLTVRKTQFEQPWCQAILGTLRSRSFRLGLSETPGYWTDQTGTVLELSEIFADDGPADRPKAFN